jgi:hypothetical protein
VTVGNGDQVRLRNLKFNIAGVHTTNPSRSDQTNIQFFSGHEISPALSAFLKQAASARAPVAHPN